MAQWQLTDELVRAEGLIIETYYEQADELLTRLAEDAEEYVAQNYQTTDEVQWFSFPTDFERLAYLRVEHDPRQLQAVEEPFDRLYADLALACVHLGDYERATEALKQAVRWNPMECEYRLRLADLYRTNGDMREYAALSFSCFERASDAAQLVRAYVNFALYYEQLGQVSLQAACLKCAQRLDMPTAALEKVLDRVEKTDADPRAITDEQAHELLAQEGIPEGANAEVVVCMLTVASQAAAAGQKHLATELTIQARDLIGSSKVAALLKLIHQQE